MNNIIVARCLLEENGTFQIALVEMECLGGRVAEIKKTNNLIKNCSGVLLPSFFNIHSHLGESLFRHIDGTDWTILKYLEYTEKYNEQLTKEEKDKRWIESARFSAQEMWNQGTVGFCAARSAEIADEYKMLTMSGYPIMNSKKLSSYKKAGIKGFKEYLSKNKSIKNKIGVFLHSIYANDVESFKLAKDCINIGAAFITVHISEDEETVNLEKSIHGISSVELLDEYGLLSEKSILVHGGYCTERDLEIVKSRGAIMAICPISNAFLNTKMIDLELLENLEIPWCIASDGLGTGRTFSLIEQARAAKNMYPHISTEKLWRSITRIPGKVFNNALYTGNIEAGIKSVFINAEYEGDDVNELFEGVINGKIKCKMIEV